MQGTALSLGQTPNEPGAPTARSSSCLGIANIAIRSQSPIMPAQDIARLVPRPTFHVDSFVRAFVAGRHSKRLAPSLAAGITPRRCTPSTPMEYRLGIDKSTVLFPLAADC